MPPVHLNHESCVCGTFSPISFARCLFFYLSLTHSLSFFLSFSFLFSFLVAGYLPADLRFCTEFDALSEGFSPPTASGKHSKSSQPGLLPLHLRELTRDRIRDIQRRLKITQVCRNERGLLSSRQRERILCSNSSFHEMFVCCCFSSASSRIKSSCAIRCTN